jgi:two-component system KDP operon response regulator KdpE
VTGAEPCILIVEDEPQMRRFLRATLNAHGYRLLEASTAAEGLRFVTAHNPELVLLDLGLPDADGIELTRSLREWSSVPIVVISARGREDDKVQALDAGADDYLTKPFGVNELLARIRVALRHSLARAGGGEEAQIFDTNGLRIDFARREVSVDGKEVHLTPIEYKLLSLLARHAGKVLTHTQMLREVWGPAYANQSHYVRVHMAELRKKVEIDPARPKRIVTEPGVGYRLRDRS